MPAVEVAHTVTGEGPPLYLVHGIGSRRTTWDALLPALSEHFTCVAYDLRGHGDSPVPPVPYSLDELVDDLEALRVRLGHERIHVMGHSLGGQIGPAYARAHPARTSSVVLLSTAAGRTVGDSAGVKGVVAAMRDQGVEAVLTTLVDRWYTDGFVAAHPEVIEHRIEQVLGTPEDVFLSVFDVYASTEMLAWLPQVGCPCLVLTGEFDGACNPRLNAVIDDALPESELVVLPALKHSVLVEGPERVLPPVLDFLLRHRD
ncbi:MAG: alpha/beta fold hydrolase [Acidimicrobiales bacterium]|jgi:pimeloyl-ACP methyl ester carboxylesterase|nr:alpha/beta fold hydrolase [Acidimicrobiales bacterium]|tara:strand:+ start:1150 stop:1926 length:777 start_codon:yes stop_codon:yes gene_type:complete